jgi:hypothetical protein
VLRWITNRKHKKYANKSFLVRIVKNPVSVLLIRNIETGFLVFFAERERWKKFEEFLEFGKKGGLLRPPL